MELVLIFPRLSTQECSVICILQSYLSFQTQRDYVIIFFPAKFEETSLAVSNSHLVGDTSALLTFATYVPLSSI